MPDDEHFRAVVELADDSWEKSEPDRKAHQRLIRHLVGEYHPSVSTGAYETSINILSMANRAMLRHMVSREPRILATIADDTLKPFVETQEIRTNRRLKKSGIAEELTECARQSLCSFGIFFMCPQYVGTPDGGMKLDLHGEAIDRCKFFHDTRSDRLEKATIKGHEMEMPLIDVRENPMFLAAKADVFADGRNSGRDESANLREQDGDNRLSLYDDVTIRCAYEPRRKTLYFWPKHQPNLKLAEIEWRGPEHGPYRFLYFEKPPGNAIPIPPLAHLLKYHRAFNTLDCRAIHQQEVAKALLAYTTAGKEEAKRVADSRDLQSVLMEDGTIRWVHIGGANPSTVSMAELAKTRASYASCGIIDQFISQADTLGQERLTRGAANEMLDDMGDEVFRFVKGVAEDYFWFDVRDPSPETESIRKPFPGLPGKSYEVLWTPEHRKFVSGLEYEVDIDPYSYVHRSPQSRLADLLGALQIMMGMMEVLAAQGISIDGEAIIRTVAKYRNLPELYDWMVLNQDPEKLSQLMSSSRGQGGQQTMQNMSKPNGRYTRQSESDGAGAAVETMRMFGRGDSQMEAA